MPEMQSVDFSSPEFLENPYPVYRELLDGGVPRRLSSGPAPGGPQIWLFASYADAAGILAMAGPLSKEIRRVRPPGPPAPFDLAVLNRDPPDHGRLRGLAAPVFSPERVCRYESRIGEIVDDLLDEAAPRGGMDFIREFAEPLPVLVIAEFLGVPAGERDSLRASSARISPGFDSATVNQDVLREQQAAMRELVAYIRDLVAERRRRPGDDLVSDLVRSCDVHGRLDENELTDMCVFLWFAGHETTVSLLGNGMLTLLRHPDQAQRLKDRPELLPSAVEEMLRFESPAQRSTFRITTEECEIGGHRLRAGEQVCAVIAAANRDPGKFPRPDEFDVARSPNPHLAFGLGLHGCPGAGLARAEARIALGRILARLPAIRLAGRPQWNRNTFFRGLRSLPVRW